MGVQPPQPWNAITIEIKTYKRYQNNVPYKIERETEEK